MMPIFLAFGAPSSTPLRGLRAFCSSGRAGVIDVVVLDVAFDRRNTLVERVEDRVFKPPPRRLGEKSLYGIYPRGRGRSEVKRPIGVVLQSFLNFGRLVEGDVVNDDMNMGSRLDPLRDEVKESEEFL